MRARIRPHGGSGDASAPADEVVEIQAAELTGMFAAPRWLRDVGFTAWLLVGVALFLVGAVWLLALTSTIVVPVIAAGVVAAVAAPLVAGLQRLRVPRALGAILLLLLFIVLGAALVYVVVAGVTSQTHDITAKLADAKSTLAGWAKDLGVSADAAQTAQKDASSGSSNAVGTLLHGLGAGLKGLSS